MTFDSSLSEHHTLTMEPSSHHHEPASPQHVSRAGQWAIWLALAALAAFACVNILMASSDHGIPGAIRLTLVTTFSVCGVGALACSIRALMVHDRRAAVWAACAVGALTTLLVLAELTIME